MAFRSNVLLRQKVSKSQPAQKQLKIVKQPTPNDENSDVSNNQVLISVDEPNIALVKEEHEMIDLIQIVEPDDEVEYTVILENEESNDSGEEKFECLDGETSEIEMVHEEEYAVIEEESLDYIPKISLKRQRSRQRNKDPDDRSLTCQECGKTSSNFSSYKYHMQLHSEDTPFLCSKCGEGFKTRNAYDGHLVTHLESNPNKCTVCGKSYRQAASLRSHMLTHSGDKVKLNFIREYY